MFCSSARNKRKLRQSPQLVSSEQRQDKNYAAGQAAARPQAPALHLQLEPVPQLDQYYPGTSVPVGGWFHACKVCRCWTAYSATSRSGNPVPLCRRCLPVHGSRSGLGTIPQQQQLGAAAAAYAAAENAAAFSASQQHSRDVLAPAPGTAILHSCCESPGFCGGGFLSPAASAAAVATLAMSSHDINFSSGNNNSHSNSQRQQLCDTGNARGRAVNSKHSMIGAKSVAAAAAAAAAATSPAAKADCQQQWQPDWWSWQQQQQQKQQIRHADSRDLEHTFISSPLSGSLQHNT
ncbi:hypothetical protein COO60DRAFT_639247 [Scenedesmus sp. NREL 46B-D3]|nr:hypothetical protein COO60DRAFT_639247 [Scenedesmus sp. NREL 46B-D3]